MKRSIVLAVALCLSGTLSAATPTCEKRLGVTWADIKQCMNELHATYPDQFPGAVFGYVPPGATQPVISGTGVFANELAHTSPSGDDDPILWLGSVSKIFTHAGALVAAEQNGIAYDSKFADIPGARPWLVDGDFYAASRARKASLTVKQVLTMTAGFDYSNVAVTDNSPLRSPAETPFFSQPSMKPAEADACLLAQAGRTDPTRQYLEEPGLHGECVFLPATGQWRNARETAMKDVAQHLMRYPMRVDPIAPGTNVYPLRYANRSSYMAGWLIEQTENVPGNQFLKANIFQPLGMTNTFSIPIAPLVALDEGVTEPQRVRIARMVNVANGYRGSTTPPEGVRPCGGTFWCDVRDWPFFWAAGGTYSTARDLLNFMTKLGDNQIPAFSATTRNRMMQDQLAGNQADGRSRTAALVYVRNGVATRGLPEGTILHLGFPGTMLAYEPVRDLASFFGTQRLMQEKNASQVAVEQFAEGKVFTKMLTTLVENVRPDNLDFHFDASRAIRSGLYPMRYGSKLPGPTDYTDGYVACKDRPAEECQYDTQAEHNSCDAATADQWEDLSNNRRVMSIATAGCAWPGNGSRSANTANQQLGPFRLRLAAAGDSATFHSPAAPTAFTMSAWVQPRTTANNKILTRLVTGPMDYAPTWQIAIENGRFIARLWDTAGTRTVVGDAVVANAWYHVVAKGTQNGALSLYVNGRPSGVSVPVGSFTGINASGPFYSVGSDTVTGVTAPGFDVALLNAYNQEHTGADIVRNCNGLKYRFPGVTCQ